MTTTPLSLRSLRPFVRIVYGILVASLLGGGMPRAALAQADYGTLIVVVTGADVSEVGDRAVRLLSGQTVSITSEQGERRDCVTKADGTCKFGTLDPGSYAVEVNGLRRATYLVRSGQVTLRNVRILRTAEAFVSIPEQAPPPPAPPTPAVEPTPVFAGPLEDRIKAGRLGVNSAARDIEALSSRNQTATPLIELLPGTFEDADQFVINGSRQNVLRVEGLDATPLELSSASFQDTGAALAKIKDRQSINSYQSFSVDTSNTPAKFGTGTGGQLLQSLKSGKDAFSGKLYEYLANDALSARNFFDFARKPSLRYNLFGLNLSGKLLERDGDPLDSDDKRKLYAFFNYEGIRASSGVLLYEAAPSAATRARAASAVAPLLDAYRAGGATIVTGASAKPEDFDILQLDTKNFARKDGVTLRFDYNPRKLDELAFIYQGAISTENVPDGVTGRRALTRNASHTGILSYKRVLTRTRDESGELEDNAKLTNQFIFGIRTDPVRVSARLPVLSGLNLSASNIGIKEQVGQTGIVGRPALVGVATPGGLLPGADFGRRGLRFEPYQFSFVDQLTWEGSRHHLNFGGELRLLRNTVNNLFGAAYSFGTLADFLANRSTVDFVGDLGSYSGDVGERKTSQEYYTAYWQDGWDVRREMRLTYGLRYEYYSVLREARDRAVIIDPASGATLPAGTPFYRSRKGNFLPRVSFAWAPKCDTLPGDLPKSEQLKPGTISASEEVPEEPCVINANKTVVSASFGMHTGPDTLDNILRPVTSDRIYLRRPNLSFPTDTGALGAAFHAGPADRKFQPLSLSRDYVSPMRAYKFDVSLKYALTNRLVTDDDQDNDDKHVTQELFVLVSYQGTRSRNLLLHNFANRIVSVETNPDPTQSAIVRREFDDDSGGQLRQPFGELDYLTTGGRANYDSLQVTMTGRARKYLRFFQASYTLARNYGNTDGDSTAGAGNPLDFDYDLGYVTGDVRHKFTFGTVFLIPACKDFSPCEGHKDNPFLRELIGGWNLGVIGNFQSGSSLDVRINRPDVVYLDADGNVFGAAGVERRAVLNVPGGGSTVAAYRPNLIPGVNPYMNGFADRLFLNPAAFSTPAPGELGNLGRGALRGPGLRVVSLSFRKDINFIDGDKTRTLRFYTDVTNVFNFTNFKLGSSKLPNVLGLDATNNQLQPGQPFTVLAAPDFGILNRTVKGKQDLGSSRQIQFGLAFEF